MPPPDGRGPVLAVCGLTAETRIAGGEGVRTVAGGGRSDALAATIEREIAAGCCALISFGIGGALSEALVPGSIVVASAVLHDSTTHAVDERWSRALMRGLPTAVLAPLAGSDSVLLEAADKAALHSKTGAAIVDMESHIAARLAAEYRLPFVALRAVADPAGRSLPPAASIAMRAGGGIDYAAVLRSLIGDPRQLPRLLRIGLDAQRALRSLDRAHRALGVRLGYADLDQLPLDVVREHVLRGPLG